MMVVRKKVREGIGGFSLVEISVVVASVAILSSVGLVAVTKVRSAVKVDKLKSDVAVLNSAVRSYLGSGGNFSSTSTVSSVISKLKSGGDGSNSYNPGVSGSLIDSRLMWVDQGSGEAASHKPRVRWNSGLQRFEITYQGDPGIAFFTLDTSDEGSEMQVAAVAAPSETKDAAFLFAKESSWVWDYDTNGEAAAQKNLVEPTVILLGANSPTNPDWVPVTLDTADTGTIDYDYIIGGTVIPEEETTTVIDPALSTVTDSGDGTSALEPLTSSEGLLSGTGIDPVGTDALTETAPTIAPTAVTLSFADSNVVFDGVGNHYFENIGNSGAMMGLVVSDSSTFSEAYKNAGITGNGDTAAYWNTNGLGDSSTTFSMDLSANPATHADFNLYYINLSGGGDKLTVSAITETGATLENPTIATSGTKNYTISGNTIDAHSFQSDLNEGNTQVTFSAPEGDPITSINVTWEESSSSTGGGHGLGIGEIGFTYLPTQ